jgi:hypothetical protein
MMHDNRFSPVFLNDGAALDLLLLALSRARLEGSSIETTGSLSHHVSFKYGTGKKLALHVLSRREMQLITAGAAVTVTTLTCTSRFIAS